MIFTKKQEIIFVLFAAITIPFLIYAGLNLYLHVSDARETYILRPMICCNERLLYDVKPVSTEIDSSFEHIGTINSSVPPSQKPQNHLEANYDCIGAELYENATGEIYLKLPNGIVLLMEYSK